MRSYLVSVSAGVLLIGLLVGLGITLVTTWLNRFGSYFDVVALWLYLQVPILLGALTVGCLLGAGNKLLDAVRGRQSGRTAQLAFGLAAGTSGLATGLLLAWARSAWWYTDVYPWMTGREQVVIVFLLSLVVILGAGALVYWLARLVSLRLFASAWLKGAKGIGRMTAAILVVGQGLLLAAVVVFGGAASPEQPGGRPEVVANSQRVVLIGLDGATWRVLAPLVAQGEVPNFRKLMERGAYGQLATLSPCNSPVLWTSIATGVRRRQHGVLNFLVQHPWGMGAPIRSFPSHLGLNLAWPLRSIYGAGVVKTFPVTGGVRLAPSLWEVAGAAGVKVGVMNWWPSWPAVEVNGFMVSNQIDEFLRAKADEGDRVAIDPGLAWPPEVLDEVVERADQEGWKGLGDEQWVRLALQLYDRQDPQLLMLYLPGPDGVQHHLWDAYEPQYYHAVPGERRERYRDGIPNAYRRADGLLGVLLERMTENTTFLIVSDHGSSPVLEVGIARTWKAGHEHAPPGILIAAGPGVRAVGEFDGASILDITPTLLALLGIPAAEKMEGRALTEILTERAAASALTRVDSWDHVLRLGEESGPSQLQAGEEEALRALGYIN